MFDVINNAGGFPPLKLKIFGSTKEEPAKIKPREFESKNTNLVSLKQILEKRKAVIPFLTTNESSYGYSKQGRNTGSKSGSKSGSKGKGKKGSKGKGKKGSKGKGKKGSK